MRSARPIFLALTTITFMSVGLAGTAQGGAGANGHFVVDKVVEGPQPEGSEFVIRMTCVTGDDLPEISQVVIDGSGNVVDAFIDASNDPTTCTITEPDDGGATSVAFACVVVDPDATCDADNRVTFPEGQNSEAAITVTNTFEEPEPPPTPEPAAEALVVEPAFTG